jgi:aryl-alcohol dehydrogenase-like predicted oxidoreductase
MDYRGLGHSGLKVSTLCLGTMMFGGATDAATSERIVARAREAGVNFIDTADVYNDGRCEEVTGRTIARDRDRWVLATKVCNPMGSGPNERGLSRKWLLQAVEASLKRLGTDYIDIYYLHKEDHSTPLEETVRALGDLARQGKIRYFGVSNYRSWRIAEICAIADRLDIARPVVSQPYYNAVNRMPEVEQLPAAAHYGLGIVPYSPMARGVLSGKYTPDLPPPSGTRAGRQDPRMMQTEWRPESLHVAQAIKAHAEKRGVTPGQFAVAWVLNNPLITAVIGGPRTPEQWEDYLGALAYRFTAEDEALIDRLVVTGHPSTPGFNDPAYPIEGRPQRSAG